MTPEVWIIQRFKNNKAEYWACLSYSSDEWVPDSGRAIQFVCQHHAENVLRNKLHGDGRVIELNAAIKP